MAAIRLSLLGSTPYGGPGFPRETVMPTTTSFDRSHAYFSGSWVSGSSAGQYWNGAGVDSTCEFTATGTDCAIHCYMAAGSAEARVDGGPWADIVPAAPNAYSTAPVFSGLADAPHAVAVRVKVNPLFYFTTPSGDTNIDGPIFSVTGAAPACAPPAGFVSTGNYLLGTATDEGTGQVGALDHVRLESGFVTANNFAAGYNPTVKAVGITLGSDGSGFNNTLGAQARFLATTTRIDVWIKNDGQAYGLAVDGVYPVHRVITPNTGRWGWVTLRSDLDGSAEHTYGVVLSSLINSDYTSGSAEVWAVRTPGGALNTASRPALRPLLLFFGHSIVANQDSLKAAVNGFADESDALQGWAERTAERLGMQLRNAGIGTTTLRDFTGDVGTLSAGNRPYLTTQSGEARVAADVVGAPVAPSKVVFLYTRNDVDQAFAPQGAPVETVAQYKASFINTINAINAGLPAADVYVLGEPPASSAYYNAGYGEADRVAFNAAMADALATLANPRNHYLDTDRWGINGPPGDATGTDYALTTLDNLHPNRDGRELLHIGLYRGISGTPTIGVVPMLAYPSRPYMLRLSGFGTAWGTACALTASAGTLGTPTVDSDGYCVVPYSAPAGAQTVFITDTASGAVGRLNVVVPALTLAPAVADPGRAVTLAITAPFTAWYRENAATIFTAPGLDLGGATVSGMGTASVSFTVPNTPGVPVVLTDTTTGRTASLAVTGAGPATSNFPHTRAAYSGSFKPTNVAGASYYNFAGKGTMFSCAFAGTAFTWRHYDVTGGAAEYSVDGGAWVAVTVDNLGISAPVTVSGLNDAAHTISVRSTKAGSYALDTGAGFSITGAAPACVPDPAQAGSQYLLNLSATGAAGFTGDPLGRPVIASNVRLEAGMAFASGVGGAGYDGVAIGAAALGSDGSLLAYQDGPQFRFLATCGRVDIWTELDGSSFALVVDGVARPTVISPANDQFGWLTLASGMDQSTEHAYGVVLASCNPPGTGTGPSPIFAVRTVGGAGVNTTTAPAPRPIVAFIGDSLVQDQAAVVSNGGTRDATSGWTFKVAEALGCQQANLGIGPTTVHDFGASVGSTVAGNNAALAPYVHPLAGEARVGHDLGTLTATPARIVFLFGTNDLGQSFGPYGAPAETVAQFQVSYQNMLASAVNACPGARIACIGIPPRQAFTPARIAPWSGAIRAAVEATGNPDVSYVDPTPWRLDGPGGTDYTTNYLDGLNYNAAGRSVIAGGVLAALASPPPPPPPPPISLSKPRGRWFPGLRRCR